jgi:hypothetical protein
LRVSCKFTDLCILLGSISFAWVAARWTTHPGDTWIDPQELECGDEAIAPERGTEPGDAGVGYGPSGYLRPSCEVGKRAIQPGIELLIRSHNEAIVSSGEIERSFYLDKRALIRKITLDSLVDFTGDRKIPLDDFSRRQQRIEADLTGMNCRRNGCTANGDPSLHMIQPLIPDRHSILECEGLQASASPVSLRSTDFEHIGKIGIHGEGEPNRNGKEAIVLDSETLETNSLP